MSSIRGVVKKRNVPRYSFIARLTVQTHQKLQSRSNLNLGLCEETLGFQIIIIVAQDFGFILSSPHSTPAMLWPIAHIQLYTKILT